MTSHFKEIPHSFGINKAFIKSVCSTLVSILEYYILGNKLFIFLVVIRPKYQKGVLFYSPEGSPDGFLENLSMTLIQQCHFHSFPRGTAPHKPRKFSPGV